MGTETGLMGLDQSKPAMFKRLRIAILLYVLLFVAGAQFITSRVATDWDTPLWVEVHPINGDGSIVTQTYVDALRESDFEAVEQFFRREAGRFGISLERPVRIVLGPQFHGLLPELKPDVSVLGTLAWSLQMRWAAVRVGWQSDGPSPDVLLFAVYHDGERVAMLERSGALRKGLIAVANVFADRASQGSNQVVFAHELLHTLGATDKYNPANNLPLHPHGFGEPGREPLYPQRRAEIMAGRIAIGPEQAQIPTSLQQVVVGPATAAEIRWQNTH